MNRNVRLILSLGAHSYLYAPALFAALAFFAVPMHAANHYVLASAAGSANGTDWTNACTDFIGSCSVGSLVRGDTYFVGRGTYGQLTLNTADSGALVITIQGATVASHGTSTGWVAADSVSTADGGAQAQFSFSGSTSIHITTDHWVFDGSVGSGNTLSSYGFLMKRQSDCTITPTFGLDVSNDGPQTDITVKHIAKNDCGAGVNANYSLFAVGCGACHVSNVNFSFNYYENGTGAFNMTNVQGIFEHNFVEKFTYNGTNSGKEVVAMTCSGGCPAGTTDFRYNIVKNCQAAGYTGGIIGLGSGDTVAINNWRIHGNVFVDCGGNSGTIAAINVFVMANTSIMNNTFINCGNLVAECEGACGSATGNTFENNLMYNSGSGIGTGSGGAAWTADYNTLWNPTDSAPSETHGQIVSGGACPLMNCAIDSTGNYHLAANGVASCASTTATCTGLTLPAPFNMDGDGNNRGADGTWERGAFEFGTAVIPSVPASLTAAPH